MSRVIKLFRSAYIGFCLLFGSCFLTYAAAELLYVYVFLAHLPLKPRNIVHDRLAVLTQNSKSGIIPHDYIMLLGDSYARGVGDWMLDANGNLASDRHPGNLIYDEFGIDTVSYGKPGAGSFSGLVDAPFRSFDYINRLAYFSLQPPKKILAFYYEGNDANNDLFWRNKMVGITDPEHEEEEWRKWLERSYEWYFPAIRKREPETFSEQLLLFKLMRTMYLGDYKTEGAMPIKDIGNENDNVVNIGGNTERIPNRLQSPALELTDEELRISMNVYERALAILMRFFPQAEISIVYVPSPVSSYVWASPNVSIETYEGRDWMYPSARISQRSDQLCAQVEEIAKKRGVHFVDSRPWIREAGRAHLVHGPRDWLHFNERGYRALYEAIKPFAQNGSPEASRGCVQHFGES